MAMRRHTVFPRPVAAALAALSGCWLPAALAQEPAAPAAAEVTAATPAAPITPPPGDSPAASAEAPTELAAATAAPEAAASGSVYLFAIAAGPLSAALDQVRQQTGTAIVYSPEQLLGLSSIGLQGRYSVEQALEILLLDTGLTVSSDGRGTLVVKPRPSQQALKKDSMDLGSVETVVVTAAKRRENAKDVAAALTAMSGKALEKLGAKSINDYVAYVPGMNFASGQSGLGLITLRGITTGMSQSSATVGTYVDETPFTPFSRTASGTTVIPDVDTFDVQRVEVLRGPQGTLYGAGSMGGLLKYVTQPPNSSRVQGRLELEPGYTEHGDGYNGSLKAMLNTPISESLAFRASVFAKRYAGYVDDVGTDTRGVNTNTVKGGRFSLLYSPVDEFSLRWSSLFQSNYAGGLPQVDLDPTTLEPLYGDLTQSRHLPETSKLAFQVHNLQADWDWGWAKFVSSTSYAQTKVQAYVDYTDYPDYGTLIAAVSALYLHPVLPQDVLVAATADIDFSKLTQEFRLSSPSNREFEWIVGGFYTHEKTDTFQEILGIDRDPEALLTLAPEAQHALYLGVPSDYKEYAGFASIDYYFTERLDLSLGARLSRNSQLSTLNSSGPLWDILSPLASVAAGDLAGLLASLGNLGGTSSVESASSDRPITYRVAPRWRATDNITFYGAAASGYRPGGPNIRTSTEAPTSFGPDTLWSYEAGFKSQFRRFAFDLTGFQINWEDIQLSSTSGGFTYLANGGKASSKGAEMNLAWRPFKSFSFGLNGAYILARLDEDAPDVGGLAGDVLPTVAKWSGTLVLDYATPLWGEWTGSVGGSVRYLGKRNSSYTASEKKPNIVMDDYQSYNLRAGLISKRLSLDLFVNNLSDERAASSIDTALLPDGGPARASLILPRTIGLRISTSF
ncbi:TonB-dependent receptor domain-containing protein [Stagnimonas aquatica]|nr:TonB-dependent receptor [Stagnimonas aquatica]